jgi:hypothetical protein
MSPIVEQLQEMRGRVAIYIGRDSIHKLAAFLRGYEHAVIKFGIAPRDEFLSGFRDWVAKRFSIGISQSWENILSFHSVDDREAMELFWKSFDEYLSEQRHTLETPEEGEKGPRRKIG